MYSCDGFCGKKVAAVPDDLHFIEKRRHCSQKQAKMVAAISPSADSDGSVTRLISLLDTDSLQSPVFR